MSPPYIWRFWCVGAGFSAFLGRGCEWGWGLPLSNTFLHILPARWFLLRIRTFLVVVPTTTRCFLTSPRFVCICISAFWNNFHSVCACTLFITSAEGEHFLVFRLFDNVYSELLAFRHILPFIFTVSKVLLAYLQIFRFCYPTDFFLLSYSSRYFHFWNHFLNVLASYFFFSVLCLFYFGHSN